MIKGSFPHDYEVRSEAADAIRQLEFDAGSRTGRSFSPIFVIDDETWQGVFWGCALGDGVTGVYSTPDRRRACVVAAGAAYLVPVDTPKKAVAVQAGPITEVVAGDEASLLVLATHDRVVLVYGSEVFESPAIASDGLRGIHCTPSEVYGEAWCASSNSWRSFSVDIGSRSVTGGCF